MAKKIVAMVKFSYRQGRQPRRRRSGRHSASTV